MIWSYFEPSCLNCTCSRATDDEGPIESNFNSGSITSKTPYSSEGPEEQPLNKTRWSPSGSSWKDFLFFCGPGWLVAVAYVDPSNIQADIDAGASAGYNLLWTLWWASMLAIYVQALAARFAIISQSNLAEVQRENFPQWHCWLVWLAAEVPIFANEVPQTIGWGVALNIFFGIPFYAGILCAPLTALLFLLAEWKTGDLGTSVMEGAVVVMIGIVSIAMFVKWGLVGSDAAKVIEGWVYGFAKPGGADIFSVLGIIGSVVMPQNLYLHSSMVQAIPIVRKPKIIAQAQRWATIEPFGPMILCFFINMAIVAVAAKTIFFDSNDGDGEDVGNANFARYLEDEPNGRVFSILFGVALLAGSQPSIISSTYTGIYLFKGFHQVELKAWHRAVPTRFVSTLVAFIIAISCDDCSKALNGTLNSVNAVLSLLLPFALTPLVKFSTSEDYLGKENMPGRFTRYAAWSTAFAVYAVTAFGFSAPGGGFLGPALVGETVLLANNSTVQIQTSLSVQLAILNDVLQVLFFAWNMYVVIAPIKVPMRKTTETRLMNGELVSKGSAEQIPKNIISLELDSQ